MAAAHRKWDSLRKQHHKANLLALKNGMNGGLGLGFWKMVTCCRPWHSKPCRDLRQRRVFMSHGYPLPLSLSLSLPPFHAHVTQHNSKIEKFRPPNCLPIHSKFPPSSPTTTTHVTNTRVIRSFWLLDKKEMATLSKSRMLCLLYLMLWLAHHCYRITLKTFY